MKKSIPLMSFITFILLGCMPTRIVTVSPSAEYSGRYSTVVTVPRTGVVTTTTQVYPASHDISLDLDLQAVGAAFAQSSTVRDFEAMLNNKSYMISNLDLNEDGYVDYLRVEEVCEGHNHLFVVQAVLGANVYQDVATIVVENPHLATYSVEIVGSPFIFGPDYFVRPVYYTHPAIFAHLCVAAYSPWHSPWYWGHYPSYYRFPAPLLLNHYQAYIHTFMRNHKFCHEAHYPAARHFNDYDRMYGKARRNDFGKAHPDRSFSSRNANIPSSHRSPSEANRPVNARDVQAYHESSSRTSVSTVHRGSSTSSSKPASASPTHSPAGQPSVHGTTDRPSGTGAATRPSGSTTRPSGSTTRPSGSSSRPSNVSGGSQTTVHSNVRNSGSSNTRTRSTTPSGSSTVRRGSTPGQSGSHSSSPSRSGSSTSTHRR